MFTIIGQGLLLAVTFAAMVVIWQIITNLWS